MTSGGSNFNDFPDNQLTKVRASVSVKANRDHAFSCSKQDFSLLKNNRLTHLGEMPGVGDLPGWVGFRPPSLHVKSCSVAYRYTLFTSF